MADFPSWALPLLSARQSQSMTSLHFGLGVEADKMTVCSCCIRFEGKIDLFSTSLGYHSGIKQKNRRDRDMTKKKKKKL